MSEPTSRKPVSVVDELLGEELAPKEPVKKSMAAKLPALDPVTFNRTTLTADLGALLAYAEEREGQARQLQLQNLEKNAFERESKNIQELLVKVRDALEFYERMAEEKQFKYRQSDLEEMEFIRTAAARTEAVLFDEKMRGQMYPNLKAVTDEWVKKVLNVPLEIDFKMNTPVFVYELADLREISLKVPIFKAFEHNRVFTGVYRDVWTSVEEKEKIRQIKVLVRLVGQRVNRVRLVDSDGNLLAECKSRRIELY